MNVYNPYYVLESHDLQHHGILGQKWGVRRFQNPDGSLTSDGIKRYGIDTKRDKKANKIEKKFNKKIARHEKNFARNENYRRAKRDDIEKKLNSSIEKSELEGKIKEIEKLKASNNRRLKDFDEGTKLIEKAHNKYLEILKDYRDAKIDVLYNGPNEAYYRAIEDGIRQNGKNGERLSRDYASEYAEKAHRYNAITTIYNMDLY